MQLYVVVLDSCYSRGQRKQEKIKKIPLGGEFILSYLEMELSKTLDSQKLELYTSAIIKSKDYISAIYAHVEYYHKDKIKELFGNLVFA